VNCVLMKESLDNFPAQEELENQTIKANNSIKIKNLTRTHQLMHFKVRNKFLQCHSKKNWITIYLWCWVASYCIFLETLVPKELLIKMMMLLFVMVKIQLETPLSWFIAHALNQMYPALLFTIHSLTESC